MRQKIVLGRRAVLKRVTLPDSTSFVARYERISRENLPGNITVTKKKEQLDQEIGEKQELK